MRLLGRACKSCSLTKTGSILIYVLWLSALLGLFTLTIGYTVRQKLKMMERIDSRRSLRLAVESGVQRGLWAINRPATPEKKADELNSLWSRNDKIFKDIAIDQTRVSVIKNEGPKVDSADIYGLTDEESKVNVNLLKDPLVLKRLFLIAAGTSEDEASVISDSILDWIDEDDHINASGAENLYYQSLKRALLPKNEPLDALEELLYVRGMTPDIYKSVLAYLTISGDGKVNLNTAAEPVLLSLGFERAVVDFILAYRAGIDQKIATRDDGVFYNTSELLTIAESFGTISADSKNALENLLALGILKVTSDFYAVKSRASRKAGRELLTGAAIISRQSGVQSWNETYTRNA